MSRIPEYGCGPKLLKLTECSEVNILYPLLTWHSDGIMRPVTELLPLTLTMASDQGWPGDIWCHASNVPAHRSAPGTSQLSDEGKIAHTLFSVLWEIQGGASELAANHNLRIHNSEEFHKLMNSHETESDFRVTAWHAAIRSNRNHLHIQIHFKKPNFLTDFSDSVNCTSVLTFHATWALCSSFITF